MTVTVLLTMVLSVLNSAQAAPPQSDTRRALDERGAHAMGFDQAKTTHHFLLYQDGGAIAVNVKNPSNTADRDAIRTHLPHLAMLFGQGSFDLPHFIHATDVPGTATMTRLKDRIAYTYRQTPDGGRVDIVTSDPEALAAIHAFLRFQITDHKTGDSLEIKTRPGAGGVDGAKLVSVALQSDPLRTSCREARIAVCSQ